MRGPTRRAIAVLRATIAVLGALFLTLVLAAALATPVLAPGIREASPSPSAIPTTPASSPAGHGSAATTAPSVSAPDVDGDRAMEHVRFFADPARGGRFTASPGYAASARYLADRFREIGLEPWGDSGTFFQHFRMPLVDLAATPTLERLSPTPTPFRHRADFTERVGGLAGSGTAEGRLIFAGGGTLTSTYNDFSGVSARGNVVLVVGPAQGDPLRAAIAEGASGLIVVSNRIVKFSYLPRFEPATIPSIVLSESAADQLLAGTGRRLADLRAAVESQFRDLQAHASPPPVSPAFDTDVRVRFSVPLTPLREVDAINVVGLLRGTDPEVSRRAVLVGGHLDGVGTDPDGTVFQAANDNATGPAVTIEVARALMARRSELRSSAIFVAFAGEEQALQGSEAYVRQTATSPGRTESLIAYINLDVVGCCGSTMAASSEGSPLHNQLRTAAVSLGIPFVPTGGSSDHVSFQRRGVDAAILDWGNTGPIHTTADRIELVTPARLRAIGQVAALTILRLAG